MPPFPFPYADNALPRLPTAQETLVAVNPHSVLEQNFPHILKTIEAMWGRPELDAYLHCLTIDYRGNREGFPPAAWEEIHLLSRIHRSLTVGNTE